MSLSKSFNDLTIIGGGLSGLALAAALNNNPITRSLNITLVDSKDVIKRTLPDNSFSNRVVSLTPTSQEFLKRINAWQRIDHSRVFPYKEMKVWDGTSNGSFSLNATDRDQIASIIEIDNIHNALLNSNVRILKSSSSVELDEESNYPMVKLENDQIQSRLVIGADGINSVVRKYAEIESVGWDYQQKGIVSTLKLSLENSETAWQRFLPSGPIAMLPLGKSMSSLVWSVPTKWTSKLINMDPDLFIHIINAAFRNEPVDIEYIITQLTDSGIPKIDAESIISELEWGRSRLQNSGTFCPPEVTGIVEKSRAAFPLSLSNSNAYAAHRIALVGDAAHRIHPLAGQGLNMGLSDADALATVIADAVYEGSDIGKYA
jgi:ubiquinone biosynthesis monooxygenase Coq6